MENREKEDKDKKKIEVYTCPICNKIHEPRELCPIVTEKLNKINPDSQSNIMGGIVLECLEHDVDFWGILEEVTYCINESMTRTTSNYLNINVDFVISYFAVALNCSPSKFYKKKAELADKYLQLLKSADYTESDSIKYDEEDVPSELRISFTGFGDTFLHNDYPGKQDLSIVLVKTINSRTSSYFIKLDYEPEILAKVLRGNKTEGFTNEIVQIKNICLGLSDEFWGYELYSEKSGKIKEFFENNFDWEAASYEYDCSEAIADKWLRKIEDATRRGLLRWDRYKDNYEIIYSSVYGKSKIRVHIVTSLREQENGFIKAANQGDGICVYENGRNPYHYGLFRDYLYFKPPFTKVQEVPQIRQLMIIIDKCRDQFERKVYQFEEGKKIIKKTDTLAVTYSFICSNKEHSVLPYCGIIKILTPEKKIIDENIYVGYCRKCDIYYVFRRDYDELCKKGTPLCRVIDTKTKDVISKPVFHFNDKSILMEMGYTVNSVLSLSAEERKKILSEAIEDMGVPVNDVLNLIELQIHLHENDIRYTSAVEKWKEDAAFVKTYGLNSNREHYINEIQI